MAASVSRASYLSIGISIPEHARHVQLELIMISRRRDAVHAIPVMCSISTNTPVCGMVQELNQAQQVPLQELEHHQVHQRRQLQQQIRQRQW